MATVIVRTLFISIFLSVNICACNKTLNKEKTSEPLQTIPPNVHQTSSDKEVFSTRKVTDDEMNSAENHLRARLQEYIDNQTYISADEAEKKWGNTTFDSKIYQNGGFEVKASMIASLVKTKKLIGKDKSVLPEYLGNDNGFFYNDHIPAFIFIEKDSSLISETWQLVVLTTKKGEIIETKIHKQ